MGEAEQGAGSGLAPLGMHPLGISFIHGRGLVTILKMLRSCNCIYDIVKISHLKNASLAQSGSHK